MTKIAVTVAKSLLFVSSLPCSSFWEWQILFDSVRNFE